MSKLTDLEKLRAMSVPIALRGLLDTLASGQREIDSMRAVGANPAGIERHRDGLLLEAEERLGKHYSALLAAPRAAVNQVEREYRQVPSGKELERGQAAIARFCDDLALMPSDAVKSLAGDITRNKLPSGFTRAHVASVSRECRLRGDTASADAIGKGFAFNNLEPWRSDPRWMEAAERLETVEKATADPRVLVVEGQGYRLDSLLV